MINFAARTDHSSSKCRKRNRSPRLSAAIELLFIAGTLFVTVPAAKGGSLVPARQAVESATEESEKPSEPQGENPASRLFLNRCSGCHTIGGGPLAGPDLLPSTSWPESDLEEATRRMQENVGALTEQQIQTLVDFMKSDDVQQELEAQEQRTQQESATGQMEEGSASTGRQLFWGQKSLTNRGTACMACHQVNGRGGTLAIELTNVSDRLGGRALISGIQQSGYPVMNAAYRDHPITRQEAVHLAAFLESAGKEQAVSGRRITELYLISTGVVTLFLLSLIYFYRNRNLGVRASLIRRKSRRGTA